MTTDHETHRYAVEWRQDDGTPYDARTFATRIEAEAYASVFLLEHDPPYLAVYRKHIDGTWFNVDIDHPPTKRAILATAALALALIPPTTHASTPTFDTPAHPTDAYLSGCEITTWEDGSRRAECDEDGAVLAYDADGQRYVNDAGTPLRAPHNWYVVK